MPNWQYILNCLNAYRSAEIDQRISPKDGMNDKWYFQAGKSAAESIALACLASEVQEIRKVCDLPCGYGRVLRHLVQLFPQADFYACDLDTEGVDFCKTTFGARPVYSRAELSEMDLGAGYDLIWVGSLFTHTSREVTRRWMAHLANSLSPQGLVVATVLGRWGQHTYQAFPYISEEKWKGILQGYNESGYGYEDYPGSESSSRIAGSRGISLVKPHITIQDLEDIPDIRIFHYQERGWADHHDVVAFGRPGYTKPWPIMLKKDRDVSVWTSPS